MATKTRSSYGDRAQSHPNALARRLFAIAEAKQTNITVSADLTTTEELLHIADVLGPYIAVFKTHIDIISDLQPTTLTALTALATKHNFLLFEDRKFVDIGATVQKQYVSGALRIHDWAHIVNAAVLAGEGIIDALAQSIAQGGHGEAERGVLILAEMTSKGSLATGEYTRASVAMARKHRECVLGFVATRELSAFGGLGQEGAEDEDFVVFTTGVSIQSAGDALGQQYQSPASAVGRGGGFPDCGERDLCGGGSGGFGAGVSEGGLGCLSCKVEGA